MRWTKLSELSSWKFWRVAQLSTSEWIYFKHPVYSYSGSRGSFSKYLIWNKPFLRFDKTSEMVIFSLGAREPSVSMRQKYPLEPKVAFSRCTDWIQTLSQGFSLEIWKPWKRVGSNCCLPPRELSLAPTHCSPSPVSFGLSQLRHG